MISPQKTIQYERYEFKKWQHHDAETIVETPVSLTVNVDVWLHHAAEQPTSWRRTSGCTGGVTAVDLLAKPNISFERNSLQLSPEAVGQLVEMLFESQELYRETGGVHTSALSDGEKVLLSAEDIGRHNTLDKIAGLCLMNNVSSES